MLQAPRPAAVVLAVVRRQPVAPARRVASRRILGSQIRADLVDDAAPALQVILTMDDDHLAVVAGDRLALDDVEGMAGIVGAPADVGEDEAAIRR